MCDLAPACAANLLARASRTQLWLSADDFAEVAYVFARENLLKLVHPNHRFLRRIHQCEEFTRWLGRDYCDSLVRNTGAKLFDKRMAYCIRRRK